MRETGNPARAVPRLSVVLGAMALLVGVMATAGGAAEGRTTLVSVDSSENRANRNSHDPSISADGRFVAFVSAASNLVANDTDGRNDVFVRDRLSGNTELVSVDESGSEGDLDDASEPSISANGRFVAFQREVDRFCCYVFVRDRQTGATESVSVDESGIQTRGYGPSISADGR